MAKDIFLKYKDKLIARQLADEGDEFNIQDISVFCNNCIGGIILNNLKQRFNSPTINLYFPAPDYVAFLERLDFYLNSEITFSYFSKYDDEKKTYPVGKIVDIEMHFVHYNNFEEAKEKWESRSKRVNLKNIFVIGSDRDFCTPEIIERFFKLPFKNKLFFSSKKINRKEVIYFREYSNDIQVGDLINDDYGWYFHFNVVKWLNTGTIQKNAVITNLFLLYRFIRKTYKVINRSQEKYEKTKSKELSSMH